IEELEKKFEGFCRLNSKEAAEAAFALGAHYFKTRHPAKGRFYLAKCLQLLGTETETLEECQAINQRICGIEIPELFHEGVVAFRLQQWEEKASPAAA
ncbi:MAG TPA: hypothetical protein PKZ12_02920, partial [Smithellaceae bacterium]|nr:hypothetical protein [Smithellaceae bacterium]